MSDAAAEAFDRMLDEDQRPEWGGIETVPDPETMLPGGESARQRFRLENDEQADWAMRKLRVALRVLSNVDAQHAERLARLEEVHRQLAAAPQRSAQFFAAILEDYGQRKRAANPKGPATFPLPSGDLKTSKSSAAIEFIDDGSALLKWAAEQCPALVDVVPAKERVLISDVRRRVVAVTLSDGTVKFHLADADGKPTDEVLPDGLLAVRPEEIRVNPIPHHI